MNLHEQAEKLSQDWLAISDIKERGRLMQQVKDTNPNLFYAVCDIWAHMIR